MRNEILFCVWVKKHLQSLQFMKLVAFTIHFKARCNVLFDFIYLFILEKLQMNASWSLWGGLGIPTASQSVLFSCLLQRDLLDMSQHTSNRSPFPSSNVF